MKAFGKGFLAGLLSGVLIVVVGLFAVAFVSRMVMVGDLAERLQSPSFPDHRELTAYGEVDYDWPLRRLDGERTTLAGFRGRTVLLNIWASWCSPCVAEIPNLTRLVEALEGEDVAVILVTEEDETPVRRFVKWQGLSLPIYLAEGRPEVFRSRGIPATFIFDRDGVIVFRHQGAARWDDESCVRFLRGLDD